MKHHVLEPQSPFVLAVDIGTSSVKTGLFDLHANSVPGISQTIPHRQTVAADGTSEEDAEEIRYAVEQSIDAVVEKAGNLAAQIAGVGFDCMASTILGVDSTGNPVTPVYTYADTRSAPDVDALRNELNVRKVYDRTGVMQHTSYVPGRIRWLRRTQPYVAAKIVQYLDISSYIFSKWFGHQQTKSSYCISSWSGLLNRRALIWDRELLDLIGINEANLPVLAPWSEPERGLAKEFADRWPLLKFLPFFLSVGDGAAASVGTGCVDETKVAITVGTTAAMRVLWKGAVPEIPIGLWSYRLGDNRSLLGGSFSEGGNVVQWALDNLKLPPFNKLDAELKRLEPASHGINVLPFIAGERATGWSTLAKGVLEGVTVSTKPIEILQAMLESVAYRFAIVADLLLPVAARDFQVIAGGGAIRRSPWWLQTMTDVLAVPVSVSAEEQDTSRGTAILALNALGLWEGLEDHDAVMSKTYVPNSERAEVYSAARARQETLYSRLLG